MPVEAPESGSRTISFDKFWSWLEAHRNCILRVGTPYSILIDQDDFHWDVRREDDTHVIQLNRAKDLVGEIIVFASDISYVNIPMDPMMLNEDELSENTMLQRDEQLFECIIDSPESHEVVYHIVISHGYEDETLQTGRWTH